MEDIFDDVTSRVKEFTEKIYIDYERESILLEVHKDYLDETIKIIKNNFLCLEIVFQKEIVNNISTIIACIPQIIDVIDEDRNVIPNMDNHYTYEYTFKHEIKELITLQSIDGIDVNTISETIVSKMMEKYCPKQTKLEAAE